MPVLAGTTDSKNPDPYYCEVKIKFSGQFLQCLLGESAGVHSPSTSEAEAHSNLLLQAAKSPKLAKKVVQVIIF